MIKSGEGITILAGRLVVLLGVRELMLLWYDQGFYLSCYLLDWRSGHGVWLPKEYRCIYSWDWRYSCIHIHGPSINRVQGRFIDKQKQFILM